MKHPEGLKRVTRNQEAYRKQQEFSEVAIRNYYLRLRKAGWVYDRELRRYTHPDHPGATITPD